MKDKLTLSIIIPAYNEEKYIVRLLKSIKKQKEISYEIIVADANSKDKTSEIAEKYGCYVVEGGKPARGRNNGAKYAKEDYILFLDADTILPKNFLKNLIKKINKSNLVIISGSYKSNNNNIIDRILCNIASYYSYITSKIKPHGYGFYICIKREIHKKIKGFDEKIFIGEDRDYVERASKYGKYSFLLNPYIIISTRRLNKEGFFKLLIKYAYCEIARFRGKKLYKAPFKYEFGKWN